MDEGQDLAERAGMSELFFTRNYLFRLGASVVFFFASSYLNTLASVCAGYRTPWLLVRDLNGRETTQRTLPDIGHDAWAQLSGWLGWERPYVDNYALPDILVSRLAVATLLFVVLHPQRFMILRRVLLLFGIMMCLRAVTVTVTQLPDASPTCQAQFGYPRRGAYKHQPMFPRAFHRAWVFFWDPTNHVTCGGA